MLQSLMELLTNNWQLIVDNTGISLYMVFVSTLFSYLFGLPLGILLIVTAPDGLRPMPMFSQVLNVVVNLLRSIPFLILMFTIMPFTQMITGSTFGANATIVPLIVSAAPFVARLIESSFKEIDFGVIEAAQSMGASNWQIITKVMLPEAKPSLLIGTALAATTILGYSAMAGVVGGGGLGDIAIRYGYYRGKPGLMYICVVLLVVFTQIIQDAGLRISSKTDKRLH